MNDLYLLVADRKIHVTVESLLCRCESMLIRSITFNIVTHPKNDPGCRTDWEPYIRGGLTDHEKALVIFDNAASHGNRSSKQIQDELEELMGLNTWQDRCKAIVIDPELEAWVWTNSNTGAQILHWPSFNALRIWLRNSGLWPAGESKPLDPKEALDRALREKQLPSSATIYRSLAQKVSVTNCQDSSFEKFRSTLQEWFPAESTRT